MPKIFPHFNSVPYTCKQNDVTSQHLRLTNRTVKTQLHATPKLEWCCFRYACFLYKCYPWKKPSEDQPTCTTDLDCWDGEGTCFWHHRYQLIRFWHHRYQQIRASNPGCSSLDYRIWHSFCSFFNSRTCSHHKKLSL